MSKEVINLWNRDKHTKVRSIFAQNSLFKDSKFTPDCSKIATLLDDSDVYFWNVSNFEQLSSIKHSKELKLECMDCTNKYLAVGGKSPYVMLYDIENYFNDDSLPLKIYKLPEGFSKGVSKLQFLRGNVQNCRLALLMDGVFVLTEVVSKMSTPEEFNVEDCQNEPETHLKILASIKLPHLAILDFDIDRNNTYVSLVTSEGLVKIYQLDKVETSDSKVTQQKVSMSSRDTISYYKYFEEVTQKQMTEGLREYIVGIPDSDITFDDSLKLKDASVTSLGNTFARLGATKVPE